MVEDPGISWKARPLDLIKQDQGKMSTYKGK